MMVKSCGSSGPNVKLELQTGILRMRFLYRSAGFSSCTDYTREAVAFRNSKRRAEGKRISLKRKELLSGSYLVYTRLMRAISKRYFLLMVIASTTTGFTGYLSRRVWR